MCDPRRTTNQFLSPLIYVFVQIFSGLQTSEDARFYALSRKFKPFSNEGKDLVIQFTVKHEQDIDCGGGYIKVFDCKLDQKDMHGESPYEIMFGPDICGPGTKKVRIFLELNLSLNWFFLLLFLNIFKGIILMKHTPKS